MGAVPRCPGLVRMPLRAERRPALLVCASPPPLRAPLAALMQARQGPPPALSALVCALHIVCALRLLERAGATCCC